MQVFAKKIQKNLVMSKKSSTFAPAFPQMGPPKILIFGESGGTSRPFDLAERYRFYDLVAEREVP